MRNNSNANTGNYDAVSYATDPTTANPSATPPIYYMADLSNYVSFSPDSVTDRGKGTYIFNLTVYNDKVQSVYFTAVDNDSYLN